MPANLTREEKKLIELFRAANSIGRRAIMRMAELQKKRKGQIKS